MAAARNMLIGLALLGGIAGLAYFRRKTSPSSPSSSTGDGLAVDDQAAGFDWPRVLAAVSGQEGGYSSLNLNDVNRGVSWGMIQFNQGAGSLGDVLVRWRQLDPQGYTSWWAGDDGTDYGAQLIRILTDGSDRVRLSIDLAHGVWPDKLRKAGTLAAVQQAQEEIAWQEYAFPLIPAIGALFGGINDVVAGIVVDRSVNQGPAFAGRLLADMLADLGPAPTGQWELWLDAFRDRASNAAGPARARVAARLERVYQALA